MPKTLEDLRDHLFATLAGLRNNEQPMEIDRARAIAEVAKTVIDSAKAEVDYIRATGQEDVELPVFKASAAAPKLPSKATADDPTRVLGVRTHRIKD